MQEKFLYGFSPEGFHRVIYYEWNDNKAVNTLLCVHGMTRVGRDFDYLAQALQSHYQVVCPDMVGRGKSDRFKVRDSYKIEQYLSDLTALIARLNISSLDWLGTSMGGILGMIMAAQPNTPVRRLILNDVGTQMPEGAVKRILGYAGVKIHFPTQEEAENFLRFIYTPFGITEKEHWHHLFQYSLTDDPEGGYTLNYDPQVVGAAEEKKQLFELWDLWDKIKCPVLVIQGENSDILTDDIISLMRKRGPQFDLIRIPRCGHAPMLIEQKQIMVVKDWLESTHDRIRDENFSQAHHLQNADLPERPYREAT